MSVTWKCCVPGCNSPYPLMEISYEEFPAESYLRKEWLKKIGTQGLYTQSFLSTVDARVCSQHFTDEDYHHKVLKDKGSGLKYAKRELRSDAVPSIFPWTSDWKRTVSLKDFAQWHVRDEVYFCSLCDFLTSEQCRLDNHMIRHQGKGNYLCSLCSYSVPLHVVITNHLRLDHHRKGDPSCGCRSCDGSEEAVNAQFCNICEYRTTDRVRWTSHLKGHRLCFQYKCDQCRFSTEYPDSLERHIRLDHHRKGDRHCPCRKCDSLDRRRKRQAHDSQEAGPSSKRKKEDRSGSASSGADSIQSVIQIAPKKEPQMNVPAGTVMDENLLHEEAELREKLGKLEEEIKATYGQMDGLREDERSGRIEPLRRKISSLEREERHRLAEMSDLTARREALRRRSSGLNGQKLQLEISIRSLEQKTLSDPRELQKHRGELRALEKELESLHHEEKELKSALDGNEEALTSLGRMLALARAELSDAAVASVAPSDQMRRLVAAQRDKIQTWAMMNGQLSEVNYKISLDNIRKQHHRQMSQLDQYVI